MNLNREQLSILITVFTLAILVLLLYNIHLSGEQKEQYVIEMSLADEDLEKLLEEEEKRLEELQKADPIKSHMAFNEKAKRSVSNPEPLKTLEEILQEKALQEESPTEDIAEADAEYQASLKELAQRREDLKKQLEEKAAAKEEFTNNLADKRTSVSFSLIDRYHIELPPPIYTCIEGGKIVVNIKVDRYGYVSEATYNGKSSNTSNGCLIDNAITYALKSRFSSSSKAEQIGTITYIFQSK